MQHTSQSLDYTRIRRRLLSAANKIAPRSLVLIISPLEGKEIDDCVIRHIHKSSTVIGISLSEVHALEYKNNDNLFKSKIKLLCGAHIEQELIHIIHSEYPQSCSILYYSQEAYNYRTQTELLKYKCELEIKQSWANHATHAHFGKKWFHNIYQNLSQHINFAIPDLSQCSHKGVALVVGAGPSLTSSCLEFIATHRSKLVIYAVDTALPVLKTSQITPDFCVLLESQYYNMNDLIPKPHKNIVALGDICCFPASLRAFGSVACISSKFANISFFHTYKEHLPPIIPPLGSVGILSLYLAILSRAQKVFFVGLDFSHYKGLSHAIHAPSYTQWQKKQNRLQPWIQANSHFSNRDIKSIRNLDQSGNSKSLRVHDTILKMFAQKTENFIFPLALSLGVECIDLNQESFLNKITHNTLSQAETYLNSIMQAEYTWRTNLNPQSAHSNYHTQISEISHPKKTRNYILTKELEYAQYLQTRIKTLATHKQLPNADDWATGLDNYGFSLYEDPYLLKNDLNFWIHNDVYSKIYTHALLVEADISSIIHAL